MSDLGKMALLVASGIESMPVVTHPDVAGFGNTHGEALKGDQALAIVSKMELRLIWVILHPEVVGFDCHSREESQGAALEGC